jgi:hypothetical protein
MEDLLKILVAGACAFILIFYCICAVLAVCKSNDNSLMTNIKVTNVEKAGNSYIVELEYHNQVYTYICK